MIASRAVESRTHDERCIWHASLGELVDRVDM